MPRKDNKAEPAGGRRKGSSSPGKALEGKEGRSLKGSGTGSVRRAAAPKIVKSAVRPRKVSVEKRLTSALAKSLPGWKLADGPMALLDKTEEGIVRIDRGPSIADLKRKFLHDDRQDDGDPFEADDGRVSVRVRPEQGGDAKTADVGPDGRAAIVQG